MIASAQRYCSLCRGRWPMTQQCNCEGSFELERMGRGLEQRQKESLLEADRLQSILDGWRKQLDDMKANIERTECQIAQLRLFGEEPIRPVLR
jgi:hypothetical protein